MKCKNNHDIADGKSFCGDCGEGAATVTKSVCGGCNAEVTGKFCSDCGDPVIKGASVADLEVGLSAIDELAKSYGGLDADLEFPEGNSASTPSLEHFAKSVGDDGQVDAGPILDVLFQAQNKVADGQVVIGAEARGISRGLGILAKAFGDCIRGLRAEIATEMTKSIGAIDSLDQRFSSWANLPRPRKAALSIVEKSIPAPGAGDPDNSPAGEMLWKSASDFEAAELLQGGDAALTQMYANQGLSLRGIQVANPQLGSRLVHAFSKRQPAAA